MGELIHDLAYPAGIPAHWAAIKLLEGDKLVEQALKMDSGTMEKVEATAGSMRVPMSWETGRP